MHFSPREGEVLWESGISHKYTMNSTKLKVNAEMVCNSKEKHMQIQSCCQNASVQTVQLIGLELVWNLHSGTWRLVIWKVPFSIKLIRPLFPRILWPSFSHWILGVGFPMMWQCNWVVEPGAKVWLAGPWRMMGGTRSEGAKGTKKTKTKQWCRIFNWKSAYF